MFSLSGMSHYSQIRLDAAADSMPSILVSRVAWLPSPARKCNDHILSLAPVMERSARALDHGRCALATAPSLL
jgi:hypothetical protein